MTIQSQSPTSASAGATPSLAIRQSNFVHEIDNPYSPMEPGTVSVFQNADGSLIDTVTVTDRTKMIDGVRCIVVHDVAKEDGQVIEDTKDYFAQDKNGNVWYFGEDTKQIENGHVVGTEGSFRAGVHGAKPGIIMEAHPQIGDSYDQENAPGVAQDHAMVLSLTGSASVPFGTFHHNLLVTHETTPLEPGAAENKYYAKGVGEVFAKDLVTGEEERLVSVTSHDDGEKTSAMSSSGAHATFANALGGHDLLGALEAAHGQHDLGHLFLG